MQTVMERFLLKRQPVISRDVWDFFPSAGRYSISNVNPSFSTINYISSNQKALKYFLKPVLRFLRFMIN